MQFTLYSRHELIITYFSKGALTPTLTLVYVHQMYSFQYFYGEDKKDLSKSILCSAAPKIGQPSSQ